MSEQTNAIATGDQFQHTQRVAIALSKSELVPDTYRGDKGVSNCIVAIMVGQRVGVDPFTVMQNMDVIHGRPSWKSSYIIAAVNASGRFAPLRFETDDKDGGRCRAWTKDKTGERLEGPWVSMDMAKAEGWVSRKGSKWQTMPEMMLRYRAAAFFGRLYAPDILNGMNTADEVADIEAYRTESDEIQKLNDLVDDAAVAEVADENEEEVL